MWTSSTQWRTGAWYNGSGALRRGTVRRRIPYRAARRRCRRMRCHTHCIALRHRTSLPFHPVWTHRERTFMAGSKAVFASRDATARHTVHCMYLARSCLRRQLLLVCRRRPRTERRRRFQRFGELSSAIKLRFHESSFLARILAIMLRRKCSRGISALRTTSHKGPALFNSFARLPTFLNSPCRFSLPLLGLVLHFPVLYFLFPHLHTIKISVYPRIFCGEFSVFLRNRFRIYSYLFTV